MAYTDYSTNCHFRRSEGLLEVTKTVLQQSITDISFSQSEDEFGGEQYLLVEFTTTVSKHIVIVTALSLLDT